MHGVFSTLSHLASSCYSGALCVVQGLSSTSERLPSECSSFSDHLRLRDCRRDSLPLRFLYVSEGSFAAAAFTGGWARRADFFNDAAPSFLVPAGI